MTQFSPTEIQIIEKEMQFKSAADIAFLLDVPESDVKVVISELATGAGISTKQAEIDARQEQVEKHRAERKDRIDKMIQQRKAERQAVNEARKAASPKKEKAPKITSSVTRYSSTERARMKKEKEESLRLKTREVNYEEMFSVRVDDKTHIWLKKGEDPAVAIANWKNSIARNRDYSEERAKAVNYQRQLNNSIK